jgi:outer membrane protein insertion porin family
MPKLRNLALILITALVGLASLSAQDSGDWYSGKTIKSVEFVGLKNVQKKDLDPVTKPYVGQAFTDELFIKLQDDLNQLDFFESLEPAAVPGDKAASSVIIRFTVVEKNVIEAIHYEGNKNVKDLSSVVTLKIGDIVSKLKIASDEDAIRAHYKEKGYPGAKVRSEQRRGNKGIILVFIAEEGSQITVKSINFVGNLKISSKTLKGAVTLKEKGFLQSGEFQDEKLDESKQKILTYYQDRGYIDAQVLDLTKDVQENPKAKDKFEASITFKVSEGKQYVYQGISLSGNQIFSTEKINGLIYQKVGAVMNMTKLKLDLDRIRNLYYENGYVFSQVASEVQKDEEKNTVKYAVTITERDRAHINEITLKGNAKTKDFVILREFPVVAGDIFSKAKVEQGLRNLYNLQYFSSIVPNIVPVSEQLVDMELAVTEQPTASIGFSAVYEPQTSDSTDNSFPLGGSVKWADTNLFGEGRNLSAELSLFSTKYMLTFAYTDNWLFGTRLTGGLNASVGYQTLQCATDQEAPIYTDKVPDPYTSYQEYVDSGYSIPSEYLMKYDSWSASVGAVTGYTFNTPVGDVGLRLNENTKYEMIHYDSDVYRPYSSDIRENLDTWLLFNTVTFYTYYNDLDLWFNPSKGFLFTNSASMAGFLSFETQQYLKDEAKAEAYFTLFNLPVTDSWNFKMVLGAHSSASMIFQKPWENSLKVKSSNYVSCDGFLALRGWTEFADYDITRLWYNWLEVRMPVVEQFLWLDGFLDAGMAESADGLLQPISGGVDVLDGKSIISNISLENMAFSCGVMARLPIQQLPLKFGFAKRFIVRDGALQWISGDLFKVSGDATSGWNFVISLTQSL